MFDNVIRISLKLPSGGMLYVCGTLPRFSSNFSLVPRPCGKKKCGLVSIVRACAKIYGIGSVNVSVNGLSHMPSSSTETVYGIVSKRTKKQTFYN